MKLKRNEGTGRGKYAVVKLNRVEAQPRGAVKAEIEHALRTLDRYGVLTYGAPGAPDEFFVIMLKDICATPAFVAYAEAARVRCDDPEYAADIEDLASRASYINPNCKIPD